MKYAPIVIFVYRRSIKNLIKSLLLNTEAKNSDLIIYSDGWRSENDRHDVLNVRSYLNKIEGFKSVTTILSNGNKGLANSIILGVSEVISKFEKIIVLEDDLIVSRYFLRFMNDALELYKNNNIIWSVSGYCPNLPCLKNYCEDAFLSLRSSSWGWASWEDRWNKVDWDVKNFPQLKRCATIRKEFERQGNDVYKMLELQVLGKIDSWAIRFCFSQFENKAFSVTPAQSMVINDGFDSYGTHNNTNADKWVVRLSTKPINLINVRENHEIIACFKKYHDLKMYTRIGFFLKKWGGYKLVKKLAIINKI